ncbi:MAG: TonB-dependent receptor [Proteobacteria bacterium]|nr:TonB-dependent receptor [Pseudomonadota bacterium]
MNGRCVHTPLRSAVAVLVLSILSPIAAADADSTGELKQLSLEQLMDVQVTSVARHSESILQAAASVQVITRDEIRRSGATSLAEALRLADNLQVAQKNAHDWGISARGFNSALANKLLVMIDGRTVYTPLFSGVFWNDQDYLLEDIDRIEVISGPGGTLWGANAVNGVINIITRSAADTQGLFAEAGGGNQLKALAAARYGGSFGSGTSYRLYGKYFDRNDEVYPNDQSAGDGWHQAQTGFRIDSRASEHDSVSLHGDFYQGHAGIDTGGTAQTAGGNVLGRWTHTISDESDLNLQTYYDKTHLIDPIPRAVLNGVVLAPAGRLHDDLTTYDIDLQHRFALGGRNSIVWGFGYRYTHDVVVNAPGLGFLPSPLDQSLFSAFVQDEMAIRSDLSLILGSKIEHNDYTGFEYEPNLRLRWSLAPDQALWSAISRAARTPSRIDRDLAEPAPPYFTVLKGGSDYGSEYVTAYELGYKGRISPSTTASVTVFRNDYRDVRSTSFTPGTIIPIFFANNLAGHTEGLEVAADQRLLENWSLHAGYDYLHESLHVRPGQFDLNNALNETADPRQRFSVRSSLDLPARVQWDATVRWVDSLPMNSGALVGTVPAFFELDMRLGWTLLPGLEVSVSGQNLLHDRHPEYGFPGPARVEIERSVYGKIAWRR